MWVLVILKSFIVNKLIKLIVEYDWYFYLKNEDILVWLENEGCFIFLM